MTAQSSGKSKGILYVGTHRRAHRADAEDIALGIYAYHMDEQNRPLQPPTLTETAQPGWIAIHPSGKSLYAVNEVRNLDGDEGGGVSAFAIDEHGALSAAGPIVRTPAMPCHCVVDASGRYLLVATFGGGSVHMYRLAEDGSIKEESDRHTHVGTSTHPVRQTAPHAHAVVIDPANRFLLVPDLGADRVFCYELDLEAGKMRPLPDRTIELPAQSGPRHLVFSQDARFAYLINEMNATVMVFSYDPNTCKLDHLQTIALLPEGFSGLKSGSALELSHDGKHLYATTRSHGSSGMPAEPGLDLLVWLDVTPATGRLALAGRIPSGGGIPRSFSFSPDGTTLFVGHQCSGTIIPFAISKENGAPTAEGTPFATPVPVCLAFGK